MKITLSSPPSSSKGTIEAEGCGREGPDKVTGTVELKPVAPKAPAGRAGGR
jgi:hypothetical protein